MNSKQFKIDQMKIVFKYKMTVFKYPKEVTPANFVARFLIDHISVTERNKQNLMKTYSWC